MKAALIDLSTNQIVNIIELEKDAIWEAPPGHIVLFVQANIGALYDHRTQEIVMAEEQP
jgi:hypothetical protein